MLPILLPRRRQIPQVPNERLPLGTWWERRQVLSGRQELSEHIQRSKSQEDTGKTGEPHGDEELKILGGKQKYDKSNPMFLSESKRASSFLLGPNQLGFQAKLGDLPESVDHSSKLQKC